MIYKADQDGVKNLHINADGEPSFTLNGTKYYAVGQPFITKGGSPVEAYYDQELYVEDESGFNSSILKGRLKYQFNVWAEDDKLNSKNESLACGWNKDKFDVYLYD